MSGSVYFKSNEVNGKMTLREVMGLGRGLPMGTRCLATYDYTFAPHSGRATLGWNAGSDELACFMPALPDKTMFILDDLLDSELNMVIGKIHYLNS